MIITEVFGGEEEEVGEVGVREAVHAFELWEVCRILGYGVAEGVGVGKGVKGGHGVDKAGIEDADGGGVEAALEDGRGVVTKAFDCFLTSGFEVDKDVEVGAEEAVSGGVGWGRGAEVGEVGGGDDLAL